MVWQRIIRNLPLCPVLKICVSGFEFKTGHKYYTEILSPESIPLPTIMARIWSDLPVYVPGLLLGAIGSTIQWSGNE